jgi:hypothetical protein
MKALVHQYGEPEDIKKKARQRPLSHTTPKLPLTKSIIILRHVHIRIRVPDIQRPVAVEYIFLPAPPSKMTQYHSLDVTPLQWRRWSDVRESESGERGDDGESVDH